MDPRRTIRPPLQSRSRRTLDRLLDASERLLKDRSFEAITVADIAQEAGCSTGAVYGRVAAKEDLLPLLYERYDADLHGRIENRLRAERWDALSLEKLVEQIVRLTVEMYRERLYFLQAMSLYARRRPEGISSQTTQRRSIMHRQVANALLAHRQEIAHDDREHAAQFALYLIASVCRDKLIFGSAPHAKSLDIADVKLIDDLSCAVVGYLTAPTRTSPTPRES